MIKNRNTVWSKAGNSSSDADKFFQLPKIANASLPTPVADGSSGENEGGIVYDTTNNKVYFSNGSSWSAIDTAGGGGADTALSNLAAVAINTSLISDTDNTDDLGSAAIQWKDLYINGVGYIDTVQTDLIQEDTADNGVAIDGVTLKDGAVTATGNSTFGGNLDVSGTLTAGTFALDALAASTTNGTITIDGDGTGGVDICSTSTGGITLGDDTTIASGKTLTLTQGNATLTDGDLVVTLGKITVDTTADETSYVARNQAATTGPVFKITETDASGDNPALFIDQNATAAASYGLEIDSEGGTGIHFATMVAAGDGILFDVADSYTGQLIVGDLGPWLGTAGEGAIQLTTDSAATVPAGMLVKLNQQGTGQHASAIDGSVLEIIDAAGAPAAGTSYAVHINPTNIGALHVDAGATQLDGTLTVGVDDTGADVKFYGATTAKFMVWDESADDLILADGVALQLGGDESTADGFKLEFDGTSTLALDALTANDSFTIGATTATDVSLQGATAGADVNWDASADKLTVTAGATLVVSGATAGDGTTGLEIPYHATATPSGTPGTGSIFFEVDAKKLWVYDGTTWVGTVLS